MDSLSSLHQILHLCFQVIQCISKRGRARVFEHVWSSWFAESRIIASSQTQTTQLLLFVLILDCVIVCGICKLNRCFIIRLKFCFRGQNVALCCLLWTHIACPCIFAFQIWRCHILLLLFLRLQELQPTHFDSIDGTHVNFGGIWTFVATWDIFVNRLRFFHYEPHARLTARITQTIFIFHFDNCWEGRSVRLRHSNRIHIRRFRPRNTNVNRAVFVVNHIWSHIIMRCLWNSPFIGDLLSETILVTWFYFNSLGRSSLFGSKTWQILLQSFVILIIFAIEIWKSSHLVVTRVLNRSKSGFTFLTWLQSNSQLLNRLVSCMECLLFF